jgi:uncharacterized protein YndB with AHSA1/START domain
MNSASDDATLEIRRVFDAPPALVFDAWLDRGQWQAWIGPAGVHCVITQHEPVVGGRYRLTMHMPDRSTIAVAGIFRQIDPPRVLAFSWGSDDDAAPECLVTLTFRAVGGRTELTLRHEGLGTIANRDSHHAGWSSALDKLAHYLAR